MSLNLTLKLCLMFWVFFVFMEGVVGYLDNGLSEIFEIWIFCGVLNSEVNNIKVWFVSVRWTS